MARVYSTRFINVAAFSGSVSYIVPAGFAAVVRDIIVTLYPVSSMQVFVYLNSAGIYWSGPATSTKFDHLDLRQVANPGEDIFMTTNGAGVVDFNMSGYLLQLP